jgi:hypothetical protein
MQLWATGFNAWNQLNFEQDAKDFSSDPDDVHKFKPLLTDDHIEILNSSLSSVLGMFMYKIRLSSWPSSLLNLHT